MFWFYTEFTVLAVTLILQLVVIYGLWALWRFMRHHSTLASWFVALAVLIMVFPFAFLIPPVANLSVFYAQAVASMPAVQAALSNADANQYCKLNERIVSISDFVNPYPAIGIWWRQKPAVCYPQASGEWQCFCVG